MTPEFARAFLAYASGGNTVCAKTHALALKAARRPITCPKIFWERCQDIYSRSGLDLSMTLRYSTPVQLRLFVVEAGLVFFEHELKICTAAAAARGL